MLCLCRSPAAEFLIDLDKLHIQIEHIAEFLENRLIGGAVVILTNDALCILRIEICKIILCNLSCASLVDDLIDDRDRGLCENAQARRDDFIVVGMLVEGEDGKD